MTLGTHTWPPALLVCRSLGLQRQRLSSGTSCIFTVIKSLLNFYLDLHNLNSISESLPFIITIHDNSCIK
ncbi:unnamed protein product [Heterosigma akashiwo]